MVVQLLAHRLRDLGIRVQRHHQPDIAVAVDFLSELFIGNSPLSRPQFEEGAKAAKIAGKDVRTMEVLAPRLGYGTLISTGKAPHVFVSRKPSLPMPEKLIADLLK